MLNRYTPDSRQRLLNRLYPIQRRMAKKYAAGTVSQSEIIAFSERVKTLQKRVNYLVRMANTLVGRDEQALVDLERLAQALADNRLIVAIDVGFTCRGPVEEVGISRLRNGVIETVNLVDDRSRHRHPDPALRVPLSTEQVYWGCHFGRTEVVSYDELIRQGRAAYEAADLVVFHAAQAELSKLGINPNPPKHIDTLDCSTLWFREHPSLTRLGQRYGINTEGAHNSGNDSRFTLEVAIAMTRDDTRERLRARTALRRQQEKARYDMIMWPSRKPGYQNAVNAWLDATRIVQSYHTGHKRNRKRPAKKLRHD